MWHAHPKPELELQYGWNWDRTSASEASRYHGVGTVDGRESGRTRDDVAGTTSFLSHVRVRAVSGEIGEFIRGQYGAINQEIRLR